MMDLPRLALSVRQPWAWAIIHGGKDIENRDYAGRFRSQIGQRICIHASRGMTRHEYESAAEFMSRIGVGCPPPAELVRGAVIGSVKVVNVVTWSDSPWFFGLYGIRLAERQPLAPISAAGQLGFFRWQEGGEMAEPMKWMLP